MEEVDDHQETKDVGALSRMPLGVTRRETQLTETPETLESRMQANLHVRFGGGPSEKESTRTTSLVAYPTQDRPVAGRHRAGGAGRGRGRDLRAAALADLPLGRQGQQGRAHVRPACGRG